MASVIQLARYRSITHRDLPLNIPAGDSDLRPIAIILWVASVVRVGIAFASGQAFGVEATLALFCVALLPCAAFRERRPARTAEQ